MKERGRFFLGEDECISTNGFVLTALKTPAIDPNNIRVEELETIFETYEASLSDRWLCLGLARREMSQGKDVLLIIKPGTQVKV